MSLRKVSFLLVPFPFSNGEGMPKRSHMTLSKTEKKFWASWVVILLASKAV